MTKTTQKVISVDDIEVAEDFNPRQTFMDDELQTLANSIKQVGVVTPITVRPGEDKPYVLIAGERRVRAAKLAGVNEIPALIRCDDEDDLAVAIIENTHRTDLTLTELAQATARLRARGYTSRKALATKLSISDKRAKMLLELTELPQALIDRIAEGTINQANVPTLALINSKAPHVAERLAHTMLPNNGIIANTTVSSFKLNPTKYHEGSSEEMPVFDERIVVVERDARFKIDANSDILNDENRGRLHKLVDAPRAIYVNVTEDDIEVARSLGVLVEFEEFCGHFDTEVAKQMVNDAVGEHLTKLEAEAAKPAEQKEKEAKELAEKQEAAEKKIREELDKALTEDEESDEYEIEQRVVKEVTAEFGLDEDDHVEIYDDAPYNQDQKAELTPEQEEKLKAERKAERERAAEAKAHGLEYNLELGKQVFERLDEVKPTPELMRVLVSEAIYDSGVDYYLAGLRYLDPSVRVVETKKNGDEKVTFPLSKEEAAKKLFRFIESGKTVEQILGRWAQLTAAAQFADEAVVPASQRRFPNRMHAGPHPRSLLNNVQQAVQPPKPIVQAYDKAYDQLRKKLTPALGKKVQAFLKQTSH